MAKPFDRIESEVKPLLELAELADRHKDPRILNWIKAGVIGRNPQVINSLKKRLVIDATNRLVERRYFTAPMMEELLAHADPVKSLILGQARDADLTVLYAVRLTHQHLLILGSTGEGKTSFLFVLVIQFVAFGSVWIFEGGAKTDFRHLKQIMSEFLIFNPETMACNPYEVHGPQKPGIVLKNVEDNFIMTNWLRDGSRAMIRKVQHRLFEEREIFAGGVEFPTLMDIRQGIAQQRLPGYSRSASYRDSLLNRIDGFLAEAPKLYTYQRGLPINELARRSFVYELQGLSPQHAAFQVYSLVSTLIDYRIATGERGETAWPVMVVIDEAKWLAPPRDELGFTPLEFLLAQARELGVSFVFSDQTTELNPSLFTQCRLLAAFRLGGGVNIETLRKAFALTDEQANSLHHLDVGQAVIRMPRVDPFVLQTPHFRME